jgi:hypothetical protein
MPLATSTIVSLILAGLAATGAAGAGGAARLNQNQTNRAGNPHKYTGALNEMFGNTTTSNPRLAQFFKQRVGNGNDYINSLSNQELGNLLQEYYYKQGGAFGSYRYDFDIDSALRDLGALSNISPMPEAPDWDAINAEAANKVASENAQINRLYDTNLARQTQAYQQNLADNNQAYNDYARQILSNDYQKNAQLMGGLSNSLDKARTSALEAGASAGLRLSNNINTLLSTQNKQAQQSLETATNLAGMMLNQRQAAAGIRNSYNTALSNDAQNRANLISGSSERTTNYQNMLTNKYQNDYNNKMTSWENAHSQYSSNPFYGSYMGYRQNNAYQGGNK